MFTMSSPAAGALHAVLVTVSAQWRPAPDSWLLERDTGTRGDTRGVNTLAPGGTLQWSPGGHQRGPGDMGALGPGWESAVQGVSV